MFSRLVHSLRQRIQPSYKAPYYRSPRDYWDRRHRRAGSTLDGVGLAGLGPEGNAEDYEDKWEHIRATLDHLRLGSSQSILDAGCGIGWFSSRAADLGFDVEGVDFSADAIDIARRVVGSSITWHVSELGTFQSGRRYDVVMCIDVLFHVVDDNDWRQVVHNLASLTADHGYLLIQEQLTGMSTNITDPSRTHIRWRNKDDYLDALPDWRLAKHQEYTLPVQQTQKHLLLFAHPSHYA